MAAKVFISYRRDDSAGHAGRLHDRLEREFGRNLLFMDVDAIALGADFVDVVSAEVAKCDVLLAVIGPGWLEARDKDGNRRLDNEQDFVRVEISAALARGIPVIPLLLEGTQVPRAEQVPDDIKGLVRRNGLDVRHASFHSDVDKLIRQLRLANTQTSPPIAIPAAERVLAEDRVEVGPAALSSSIEAAADAAPPAAPAEVIADAPQRSTSRSKLTVPLMAIGFVGVALTAWFVLTRPGSPVPPDHSAAECRENASDLAKVIAACTSVLSKRPHAAAYFVRAEAYQKLEKYDLAVDDYTKSMETGVTLRALKGRADAYTKMGKDVEAARDNKEMFRILARER